MAKVTSFDASQVKLTCDEPTIRNLSERWVVQFVGSPGFNFNGEEKCNVHYVCPYIKHPSHGWLIDPWKVRFLVKNIDHERGVVTVDGITKDVEFYVEPSK